MLTRSRTMYEVNIDFDEASVSWKSNKKTIGNGQYKYICIQYTKTGKPCNRSPLHGCDYCKMHAIK